MLSRQAATSLAGLATRRSASTARAFTTQSAAGIPVAAADDGAPTSAVTVAVRAGSRFESTPGAAHVLKNFLFKSTEKRSAMRLVRESELYGGVLSASVSKEQLLLTAEFLRGDEDYFVEVLGDVLSSSRFVRHEFDEEVVPSVQSEYEQSLLQPSTLGLDVLTQTAYRHRGVGASLFASPSSPVSYKDAVSFARSSFSKSNIAVLGSGIESSRLASLVSSSFANVSSGSAASSQPSKYFGGEQRVSYSAPHGSESPRASYGHYLMAFEGAGTGKAPELAVLRALLGGESSVKWSKGISPLSKLSESHQGLTAQAFNLTFSDTGLFGAYLTAPQDKLAAAAKDVANAIKEVASKASDEQVQAAIAKAKFEAANAIESRSGSHAVVGASLLNSGNVATLDSVFSALDGVKASAVSQAAEKLLKSKPTSVAIGDVHKLPYADELF